MMKFRVSMISCLVLVGISSATAAIVAFDAADPKFKPEILAGNGPTHIINIQAADNNGVSRNIYSEFNPNRNSVIFNNSDKSSSVILNGADNNLAANPLLTGGTAKIILNEVNSDQITKIGGGIEVAGDRADIIIANPNGIDVDGAMLFNTGRLTLAAGNAVFNENNDHTGYRINGGNINLADRIYTEGADLDVLASSVNITNVKMRENNSVKIVVGNNDISKDLATVQHIESATDNLTGLTLSNSSIYSDNISIKSTNAGAGINLSKRSTIAGQKRNSNVNIDSNGLVKLDGSSTLQSEKNLALNTLALENDGVVISYGNTTVNSKNSLKNGGVIRGYDTTITTDGLLTNDDFIDGSYNLNISAGDINNNKNISSMRTMNITAIGQINNNGEISINNFFRPAAVESIRLSADVINNNGRIRSDRNIAITANNTLTNNRDIQARHNLDINTNNLVNNTSGVINSSQAFYSSNTNLNINATNKLTNRGTILSGNGLTVNSGDIENETTGKLIGRGNTQISARSNETANTTGAINNAGVIVGNNYYTQLQLNGSSINNTGSITTFNSDLALNSTASITNSGEISSRNGEININAATDLVNSGEINASQNVLNIHAGDVLNNQNSFIRGQSGVHITATKNAAGERGNVINNGIIEVNKRYSSPYQSYSCYHCFDNTYHAPLVITGENVSNSGKLITNNLTVNAPDGNYSNTGSVINSPNRGFHYWWGW